MLTDDVRRARYTPPVQAELVTKEATTPPFSRQARLTLFGGGIRLLDLIRRVPFGLLLLVIGLSFPIGPHVGPIVVTLADLAIVWLTVQLGVGIAVHDRRLWVPLAGGWALFMIGAFGSMAFSQDVGESLVFLIEKIEMLLVFYLVVNFVRNRDALAGLLFAFVLCGVVNAGLGLAQFLGWIEVGLQGVAFVGREFRARAVGFVGGTLGAYLGSALVILAAWLAVSWRRWTLALRGIGLLGLAALTAGLIATMTRTWIFVTLVALAVLVVNLKWQVKLRMFVLALVALGLLAIVLQNSRLDTAGEGATEFLRQRLLGLGEQDYFRNLEGVRYAKWAQAWNDFCAAPIFGVGMGTERFLEPRGTYGLVDNHYLGLLAEMGLVGTLGFAWIAGGVLLYSGQSVRFTRDRTHHGSALGLFSSHALWLSGGMMWCLFDSGKPGMTYVLLIALAMACWKIFATEDAR